MIKMVLRKNPRVKKKKINQIKAYLLETLQIYVFYKIFII